MADEFDVCKVFGQRLRTLRLARGFSQEKLAEKAGLDRTYVSGVERGMRNVSLRNLSVIATALDISISELLDTVGDSEGGKT